MIFCDVHEKESTIPDMLSHLVDVEIKALPCDYLWFTVIGSPKPWERKTATDFIGSYEEAITTQLGNMQQIYGEASLLIEGHIGHTKDWKVKIGKRVHNISYFSIMGYLRKLADYGIPVIRTFNKWETAWTLHQFHEHDQEKEGTELKLSPFGARRITSITEEQKILSAFPGIGLKTADKLISTSNSLIDIYNTDLIVFKKLLGSKRGTNLFDRLHKEFKEEE